MMVFGSAMGPGVTGFLIDFGVPFPTQLLAMGAYSLFVCLLMVMVGRKVMARNQRDAAIVAA